MLFFVNKIQFKIGMREREEEAKRFLLIGTFYSLYIELEEFIFCQRFSQRKIQSLKMSKLLLLHRIFIVESFRNKNESF